MLRASSARKSRRAVGFISQIFFLTIIIANAISIGSLALVCQAVGAGDPSKAVEVARQSLMSAGLSLCLTVPGLIFYNEIVTLAGFPSEIRILQANSFRFSQSHLEPIISLSFQLSVRACGEVKKPLLTMTVVSIYKYRIELRPSLRIYPFRDGLYRHSCCVSFFCGSRDCDESALFQIR